MTERLQPQTNPLSPEQYKELLPRIGLSFHEIGRRVGKTDTTVRRVLLGETDGKVFCSKAVAEKIHKVVFDEIVRTDKVIARYLKRAA